MGKNIDNNPIEKLNDMPHSDNLIIQVDGGHIKTTEEQRSIEALTAVIYNPNNVIRIKQHLFCKFQSSSMP